LGEDMTLEDSQSAGFDLRAVLIGGAAALTLCLALTTAVGDQGFSLPVGNSLVVAVQAASFAAGGFLSGRLRRYSPGESDARTYDTMHGLAVSVLGLIALFIVQSVIPNSADRTIAARSDAHIAFMVDALFEPLPATPGETGAASSTGATMAADGTIGVGGIGDKSTADPAEMADVTRILTAVMQGGTRATMSDTDRSAVARLVAIYTDRTTGEALRRVDQVVAEAKRLSAASRQTGILLATFVFAGVMAAGLGAALGARLGGGLRKDRG